MEGDQRDKRWGIDLMEPLIKSLAVVFEDR